MRVSKELTEALYKGWRNTEVYSVTTPEHKSVHAEATVKALREAGFKIIRAPRRIAR